MLFDLALARSIMPQMLQGLGVTVALTATVLVAGMALAIPIALARLSTRRILRAPATAFVTLFRGAPALILLYLVYYGLAQLPVVRSGPLWLLFSHAFACAAIGLTLSHASYVAEIIRGGLIAVPAGLTEACAALGLSHRQAFISVRFPLAIRFAMKAYQNEVIMFTKGTAVVGVITVVDLTAVANDLFERTYDPITPMLTAAAIYWSLINLMRLGFVALDRALNRHLPAQSAGRRKPSLSLNVTLDQTP